MQWPFWPPICCAQKNTADLYGKIKIKHKIRAAPRIVACCARLHHNARPFEQIEGSTMVPPCVTHDCWWSAWTSIWSRSEVSLHELGSPCSKRGTKPVPRAHPFGRSGWGGPSRVILSLGVLTWGLDDLESLSSSSSLSSCRRPTFHKQINFSAWPPLYPESLMERVQRF